MTKPTKRSAMLMAAGAPIAGLALPFGGEVDGSTVGILIRLSWQGQWRVLVPYWEEMAPGPDTYWKPGQAVPTKWIPLKSFLEEIENEYNLKPTT